MQSENPLVADFVKMINSAAGTFAGMTREAREGARERMKEAIGGLDFVSREEFDAVKDMAAKAREEARGARSARGRARSQTAKVARPPERKAVAKRLPHFGRRSS